MEVQADSFNDVSITDRLAYRKVVEGYMDRLSDIRKSATVICDSIRVRERNALSLLGVSTGIDDGVNASNSDPIRCCICMTEFEDPCVAIKVCGHGLHEKCMKTWLKRHSNGEETRKEGSRQKLRCPLCRTPFMEKDILRLVGMHPPKGQAAVWRAIQLSSPWKERTAGNDSPTNPVGKVESLAEKLYISLRALFQQTNELTRMLGSVLRLYDDASSVHSEIIDEKNRVLGELAKKEARLSKKWIIKMTNLDEREKMISSCEYQEESLLAQCLKAVKREEASNLNTIESIVVKQNRLHRLSEEVRFREERLKAATRDFEKSKQKHEQEMREREEAIRNERRLLDQERNSRESLGLAFNNIIESSDQINPAFSEPESDQNDSDSNGTNTTEEGDSVPLGQGGLDGHGRDEGNQRRNTSRGNRLKRHRFE